MKRIALGALLFILLLSSSILAQTITVKDIRVSDITDKSAKISWSTNVATNENYVYIRQQGQANWTQVTEDATTVGNDVHFAVIPDVCTAGTTYEVKVKSNGVESSAPYTTFTTLNNYYLFAMPKMFTGYLYKENHTTPSARSMVYAKLKPAGGSVINYVIASLTNDSGVFALDMNLFRRAGYTVNDGDSVVIFEANGGSDGHLAAVTTVAFSGSSTVDGPFYLKDDVAPVLISGRSYDSNGNGLTDKIELTFDENVQGNTGFSVVRSYDNASVTITGVTTSGTKVIISLNETQAGTSGLKLSYSVAAGNITDTATTPNEIDPISNYTILDQVAPIIISASAIDIRGGSLPDSVTVTFSEPVTAFTLANVNLQSPSGTNISLTSAVLTFFNNNLSASIKLTHTSLLYNNTFTLSLTGISDASGNTGNSTATGIVTTNDNTPPTVTITSPTNNAYLTNSTINVTGNLSGEEDAVKLEYRYKIANGAWSTWTTVSNAAPMGAYNFTFQITTDSNGDSLQVKATDIVGLSSTASVRFNVDLLNPVVNITTQITGNVIVLPLTIQGNVTNAKNSGLANVYYSLDNPTVINNTTGVTISGTNFMITLNSLTNGNHTLYVKAVDNAGRESAPASINFNVLLDTQAPVIQSVTVTPYYASSTVTVRVKFRDMPDGANASGLNYAVIPVIGIRPFNSTTTVNIPVTSYQDSVWTGSLNISSLNNGLAKVRLVSGAADIAGNTMAAQDSIASFIIDTQAPIITANVTPNSTINAPANTDLFTVSGTITDNIALGQASYKINNGTAVPITVAANGTYTFNLDFNLTKVAYDTMFTLTVMATDISGNTAEPVVKNIYIDVHKPVITTFRVDTLTNTSTNPPYTNYHRLIVSGTVSDTVLLKGEIARVEINIVVNNENNDIWYPVTFVANAFNFTFNANEGIHLIKGRAIDKAGNVSDIRTLNFIVDYTAPVLTNVTVTPTSSASAPANTYNFVVRGKLVETGAGMQTFYYQINNGVQHPITTDAAGLFEIYLNLSSKYDHSYNFKIAGRDFAGNTVSYNTTIYVDVQAPVVTLNPVPAMTNASQVTISGKVTDYSDKGNIKKVEMCVNDVWTPLTLVNDSLFTRTLNVTDGTYVVKVRAYDTANNVSNIPQVSFLVDQTNPVLTVNVSPSGGTANNPTTNTHFTFSGNVVETGSGIKKVIYRIDNSTTEYLVQVINGVFTPFIVDFNTDGHHTVTVVATDNVNNTDTEILHFYIDTHNPILTLNPITSPTNAAIVTISGTVNDNFVKKGAKKGKAVSSVQYRVNYNGTWNEWQTLNVTNNTFSKTIEVTDGVYRVQAKALDTAGLVSDTDEITFNVDRTNPTIVSGSVSPLYANGYVTIKFSLTDNLTNGYASTINPAQTTVTVNEIPISASINNATTWEGVVNTAAMTEGTKVIVITVRDYAGNIATNNQYSFHVDRTAPVVTNFTSTFNSQTQKVTLRANISENPLSKIEYKYNSFDWTEIPLTSLNEHTMSYEIPNKFTDGTYIYSLRCYDLAGNVSETKTSELLIDTVPPQITIRGITDGQEVTVLPLVLEVTVSEPVSLIEYQLDNGDWHELTLIEANKYKIQLNTLAAGNHTINVRAYDLQNLEGRNKITFYNGSFIVNTADIEARNYPNPATNNTTIVFKSDSASGWLIKIFDFAGQDVVTLKPGSAVARRNGDFNLVTWNCQTSNGTKVAPGVYLVHIEKLQGGKIVKEKIKIAVIKEGSK